jgi:hypothetical protein
MIGPANGDPPMPFSFIALLPEAAAQLKRSAAEIKTTYEQRRPTQTSQTIPHQLVRGLEEYLAIAQRLDRESGETAAVLKQDVSQLGDYALNLLMELHQWAVQLQLPAARESLDGLALTIADWVLRHHGELRTLDPIVNALAGRANRMHTPAALQELERFMSLVIQACANLIKQDLERANPGRPWRVLHLNRGIVATRTHNPQIMEQVFDDIVRYLPDDAANFFGEGMQQMDALNYPPHVREVMSRYYEQWTRRRMH